VVVAVVVAMAVAVVAMAVAVVVVVRAVVVPVVWVLGVLLGVATPYRFGERGTGRLASS
jgi:hypothetical protein